MRIIVDSNIVFSAILNMESRISQLLFLGSNNLEFFSIFQFKAEIQKHKTKILSISGYSEDRFSRIYEAIISKINFIDLDLISDYSVHQAIELVKEIDENDALFVALGIHLNAKIWTGDRKLKDGLSKKGFKEIVMTEELYQIFLK